MEDHQSQDFLGQNIYLTFDPRLFSENPGHVLVVPVYNRKLVFTRHPSRGWELPGGKVEPGERPIDAAVREVWEETGAVVNELKQVGEYTVEAKDGESFRKAIFLAQVATLETRPSGFETVGVQLFPFDVDAHSEDFSPIMKDRVFEGIKENILKQFP